MRTHFLAGLAAAVLMTAYTVTPCRSGDAPAVFRSTAGRFSVMSSSSPTEQETNLATGAGTVRTHLFVFQGGRQSRMATYADYPSGTTLEAAAILDDARDGFVSRTQGTLVSEKKIAYERYPGRELRVETKSGILMVVRTYVAGTRLYQVLAGALKREFPEQEAAVFLDSFKVTP